MVFVRGIVIATVVTTPFRAGAFAPVKSGLTEARPVTPKAARASVAAPSMAKSGRTIVREDGSFAFLGRHPLGSTRPTVHGVAKVKQSMDLRSWAVAEARAYLIQSAGDSIDPDSLVLADAYVAGDTVVVHFEQQTAFARVQGVSALVAVGPTGVRYARHNLLAPLQLSPSLRVSSSRAQEVALAHVLQWVGEASPRSEPEKVVLFDQSERATLAWRVEVDTRTPNGWWAIYVNADDAGVMGREKLSLDGVAGTVRFAVEPLCQGDTPELREMPHIEWNPGENTDSNGGFSTTATPDTASVVLDGPYFTLHDQEGQLDGPWQLPLQPQPAQNDLEIADASLAQVDALYYANVVRSWMLKNGSDNRSQVSFAESKFDIFVNIDGDCNAYYDGWSINFYHASNGCNNTGRVATIVYHEYGHAIHDNSGRNMDDQVSEGISDFTSATILNDPDIKGIFGCDDPFRSCRNDLTYCNRGCDFSPRSDAHDSGQAICGVLWEFRELMIDRYGYDQGVAQTDRIFLKFLTLVGDMDSAYDAAIAADDDDDDDPSNGTTHSCQINRAFADDSPGGTNHFPELDGMVPAIASATLTHEAPGAIDSEASSEITLDFKFDIDVDCLSDPDTSQIDATLFFQIPGEAEQEVELQSSGATNVYTASIEGLQPPIVMSYYARFEVEGHEFYYPAQPDDPRMQAASDWPMYRQGAYLGDQETIFFDDLEGEPLAHTLITQNASGTDDGLSDWQLGVPSALAGGPSLAHSGDNVWGTNLGGNYSADRVSTLELGPLDTRGFAEVRLQLWRQLFNADVARIEVNGETVYEQEATDFDWQDPEWIFHDIDISALADDSEDVRIRFVVDDALDADRELAGLYIDDLRLVGTPIPGKEPARSENADSGGLGSLLSAGCACSGSATTTPGLVWLVCAVALYRRRRW